MCENNKTILSKLIFIIERFIYAHIENITFYGLYGVLIESMTDCK